VHLRDQSLRQQWQQTQSELARAQAQIAELEALLEDLPGIFERKFQQRLEPLLERQQHLLEDNNKLRQELRSLNAAPPRASWILPACDESAAAA
jgi:DNA repair exonuclease SbcCD ATPase subunit